MSFSFAGRLGQVSALQRGLFCQAHMAGTGTEYTGSGDTAGHYVAQSWFTFDKRLDADAPAEAMAYITRAGMSTSAFQQSVPSQRRESGRAGTSS